MANSPVREKNINTSETYLLANQSGEDEPKLDYTPPGNDGLTDSTNKNQANGYNSNHPEHPAASAGSPTKTLILLTTLAALGGFLFGYDTGVISGALLLLKDEFNLSTIWQEVIVSVTTAGAALSALFTGLVIVDAVGRRPVILAASAVFTIGAVILAAAKGTGTILAGRLVVGLAIGLASVTVPIYIAESAPAALRGRLVTLFQVNIVIGMFLAVTLDAVFSHDKQNGWRYMFGLSAVPAVAQLIGMCLVPESPRWLVGADRVEKAQKVLQQLRGHPNVQEELEDIISIHREEQEIAAKNKGCGNALLRILKEKPVRRALFVGCSLQMFQQVVGINTVMYYSATIIHMAGITDNTLSIWLAAATSGVNVIGTLIGINFIDRFGRRPLLLSSLIGVFIGLLVLTVGFSVTAKTTQPVTHHYPGISNSSHCSTYRSCNDCVQDADCGFCTMGTVGGVSNSSCLSTITPPSTTSGGGYFRISPDKSALGACSLDTNTTLGGVFWTSEACPSPYGWVVVLGMAAYLLSFSIGMGPIPWTMNSEIYPLWARGSGCALSTAVNWSFNLLISMTFLSLTELLTIPGAFGVYALLTVLAVSFAYFFVPETKGLTLENIEKLFEDRQWGYQQF